MKLLTETTEPHPDEIPIFDGEIVNEQPRPTPKSDPSAAEVMIAGVAMLALFAAGMDLFLETRNNRSQEPRKNEIERQ